MKKVFFLLAVAAAPLLTMAQTKWTLDKSHSSVKFEITHLVISDVEGSFKMFDGSLESADATGADFSNAKTNFTVDVKSVNTEDEKRDAHLQSDDFFSTEKFPKMSFVSTSFKKVKGNMYTLEGNLTIRDVTKKVKFAVVHGGTVKDPWGNTKAGFKATTKINRRDFGINYGTKAVVGDDVSITVNTEFAQAK